MASFFADDMFLLSLYTHCVNILFCALYTGCAFVIHVLIHVLYTLIHYPSISGITCFGASDEGNLVP